MVVAASGRSELATSTKSVFPCLNHNPRASVAHSKVFVGGSIRRKPVLVIILEVSLKTWRSVGSRVRHNLAGNFDDLHILVVDPYLTLEVPRFRRCAAQNSFLGPHVEDKRIQLVDALAADIVEFILIEHFPGYVEPVDPDQPAKRGDAEKSVIRQGGLFLKHLFGDPLSLVAKNAREAVIFAGDIITDADGLNSQLLIPGQAIEARARLLAIRSSAAQYLSGRNLLGPAELVRKWTRDQGEKRSKNQEGSVRSQVIHKLASW